MRLRLPCKGALLVPTGWAASETVTLALLPSVTVSVAGLIDTKSWGGGRGRFGGWSCQRNGRPLSTKQRKRNHGMHPASCKQPTAA